MTDTKTYAERREARRRLALLRGLAILVVLGTAVALRVGWLPLVPVFVVAAVLVTVSAVRARQATAGLQRPAQRVTLPMSWSATAPLWVARNQQPSAAAEGEVFGHLTCEPSGWTWQPTQRAQRMGALTLHWAKTDDLHVSLAPIWGLTPMCHVTLSIGPRGLDLWVRAPAVDVRDAVATTQLGA